jgi:hypothetical protein
MQAGCKSVRVTAPYSFVSSSLESPHTAPAEGLEAEGLDKATLGLERVTGFLSAACAIHCLLMPLVVALLPLVGTSGIALGGTTELVLSALVLVSGTASLVLGYRRHRDGRIAAFISACLVLYLVGHAHEAAWYGTALAVVAGLGLAAASFWSARLGHMHDEECAH